MYLLPLPRASLMIFGAVVGCLGLALGAGCGGVIPADPYLGTIDPSGFDPLVAFATTSTPVNACLQPRKGLGGASGLDAVPGGWVYLGGLSPTQLDLANASDPTKALPPAVYQVSGCNAPEGRADRRDFDPRLDNYLPGVQYPVISQGLVPALAGAASEPTRLSTYKPFQVVVPVAIQSSIVDRMGCNDIKGERSLLERAGWQRDTKTFPDDGPHDFAIGFPGRDDIRAGKAKFKDWPMVSVAVPVLKSTDASLCPFVNPALAVYPRFPGDPQANFQFPTQHWLRGLLGGYLDGGDLPVTTDPTLCPAIVPTVKDCSAMAPCSGAGELCSAGKCLAPVPVCPLVNDLYVAKDEVPVPTTAAAIANPMPNRTVTLTDPVDMTMTRSADILAIFSATPGQPGFSPVCRLRFFDKSKVSCGGRAEIDRIAPRPLCTAQEIKSSPGAVVATSRDYFVHCLFVNPANPA
jgi:hypothetical protein